MQTRLCNDAAIYDSAGFTPPKRECRQRGSSTDRPGELSNNRAILPRWLDKSMITAGEKSHMFRLRIEEKMILLWHPSAACMI
jgi:hypothetical protein